MKKEKNVKKIFLFIFVCAYIIGKVIKNRYCKTSAIRKKYAGEKNL